MYVEYIINMCRCFEKADKCIIFVFLIRKLRLSGGMNP